MDRFTANSGEIFMGNKPEVIAPKVNMDKVLEIMIGQLKVLQMMTCPAIYLPLEQTKRDNAKKTEET